MISRSQISQSYRFMHTIPRVTATTLDGTIGLSKARELDLPLLDQHKYNPTGLIHVTQGPLQFVVASTKDNLKRIFKLDAKGLTDTAWS